jgi:hypothetical protein
MCAILLYCALLCCNYALSRFIFVVCAVLCPNGTVQYCCIVLCRLCCAYSCAVILQCCSAQGSIKDINKGGKRVAAAGPLAS